MTFSPVIPAVSSLVLGRFLLCLRWLIVDIEMPMDIFVLLYVV